MSDSTLIDQQDDGGLSEAPLRPPKSPLQRGVEQRFIHVIALIIQPILKRASLGTMRRIAVVVAWLVHRLSPRRVRMAEANIRAAFGDRYSPAEVSRICYLSVVNILKTVVEMMKLPWIPDEDLRACATITGLEHLEAALAQGNGAIVVTAHYGNWEWSGALASIHGYPVSVVARDANSPAMRSIFNDARESKGLKVLGRKDTRQLIRALKQNECIALLPDQHATDGAVRCTFLGRPADTHSGPAMLAIRTGAKILPAFAVRADGDMVHVTVYPALELPVTGDRQADVLAITQMVNDAIGEQILAHPEQWLWFHNRWKAKDEPDAASD